MRFGLEPMGNNLCLLSPLEAEESDFRLISEGDAPLVKEELFALEDVADAPTVLKRLKNINWAFTADPTNYLSHDLHPYPAKFIPQIPRNVIARLSLRGELVYDPFGGSGTTALEAILLGRRALSTDAHPLAKIIGEAKTLTLTKEEEEEVAAFAERLLILSRYKEDLEAELSQARDDSRNFIPDIPNMSEWFHENAIEELGYLRWRIQTIPGRKVRTLAEVVFSRIILKASYQDGETRYARRRRE